VYEEPLVDFRPTKPPLLNKVRRRSYQYGVAGICIILNPPFILAERRTNRIFAAAQILLMLMDLKLGKLGKPGSCFVSYSGCYFLFLSSCRLLFCIPHQFSKAGAAQLRKEINASAWTVCVSGLPHFLERSAAGQAAV
jgi:hypothetical protein